VYDVHCQQKLATPLQRRVALRLSLSEGRCATLPPTKCLRQFRNAEIFKIFFASRNRFPHSRTAQGASPLAAITKKYYMKSKELIKKLYSLLEMGKIQQVITILKILLDGSGKLDEIIIQSARYNEIMRKIRLGTINFENSILVKNQIMIALIHMITELENNVVEKKYVEFEFNRSINRPEFKAIGIIAKGDIKINVEKKDSNISLSNLESQNGEINIDIKEE